MPLCLPATLVHLVHCTVHRLRDLLQSEEESYLAEAAAKQETVLERQARMRERAKFLKEKREAERLALVEKKLDQRWRF